MFLMTRIVFSQLIHGIRIDLFFLILCVYFILLNKKNKNKKKLNPKNPKTFKSNFEALNKLKVKLLENNLRE